MNDTDAGATLVGQVGFVSLAIPIGRPGEVILPVRGGTEAFAAWSDEATGQGLTIYTALQSLLASERNGQHVNGETPPSPEPSVHGTDPAG